MSASTLVAALCLIPGMGLAQELPAPSHVEIHINSYPEQMPQEAPVQVTPKVQVHAIDGANLEAPAAMAKAAPAPEAAESSAPEVGAPGDSGPEPKFSIGLAAGTTHWGPTISLRSDQGVAISFTFVPIVIDGWAGGHAGIRLTQDLKTRRSSQLYGVLGVGVSGSPDDVLSMAAGAGLGIRTVPQNWERGSLWGEMKLTALGADGEVMAVLPLPTVGISWGF